eukprot:s746_g17.t1
MWATWATFLALCIGLVPVVSGEMVGRPTPVSTCNDSMSACTSEADSSMLLQKRADASYLQEDGGEVMSASTTSGPTMPRLPSSELAADAHPNDTEILVTDVSGFHVGDHIVIQDDAQIGEERVILDIIEDPQLAQQGAHGTRFFGKGRLIINKLKRFFRKKLRALVRDIIKITTTTTTTATSTTVTTTTSATTTTSRTTTTTPTTTTVMTTTTIPATTTTRTTTTSTTTTTTTTVKTVIFVTQDLPIGTTEIALDDVSPFSVDDVIIITDGTQEETWMIRDIIFLPTPTLIQSGSERTSSSSSATPGLLVVDPLTLAFSAADLPRLQLTARLICCGCQFADVT